MIICSRVWILFVTFGIIQGVEAKEPITHAFGIELGKTLDEAHLERDYSEDIFEPGDSFGDESLLDVWVEAPTPNKLFSLYEATVERGSQKVVRVRASGHVTGKTKCLSKLRHLGRHLTKKYGGNLKLEEHGASGEKNYIFVIDPPNSRNLIGGACSETNLVDNGFSEKGIFDSEEDTTYVIKVTYNLGSHYHGKSENPEKGFDGSGL